MAYTPPYTNDPNPLSGNMDAVIHVGIQGPRGPQGDPFTYEDFTPEQLEGLRAPAVEAAAIANTAAEAANTAALRAEDALYAAELISAESAEAVKNANSAATTASNAANLADSAAKNAEDAASAANAAAENTGAAIEETLNAKNTFLETAGTALAEIREVVNDGMDAPPIVCNTSGSVISIDDSANRMLQGMKVYGKTTQNGTPTPDAPVPLESVGDDGSVGVTVAGKNLWRFEDMVDASGSNVVIRKTDTGLIAEVGSSTQYLYRKFKWLPISILDGKNITLSAKSIAHGGVYPLLIVCYMAEDGTATDIGNLHVNKNSISFIVDSKATAAQGKKYIGFYAYGNAGSTTAVSGDYSEYADIQIEVGETATEYKPYKGQPLTIQKPENVPVFLPGIPVSSGGNYTDENGQQWICDEVDFARGKYFQRIDRVVLDGSEDETWTLNAYGVFSCQTVAKNYDKTNKCMCSHYPVKLTTTSPSIPDKTLGMYNNNSVTVSNLWIRDSSYGTVEELVAALSADPVTVIYPIKKPAEYDLSADELAQYATLHTNYPNTTIFNDGGAGMEVKYVADTKLYIDKKFAELSTALLNQ